MADPTDYHEDSLPFQKKTESASQQPQAIEITEIDFSEALIKSAKTTFKRMLFHIKAGLVGATAQILKLFIPSNIDPFYGATFLASYLGIVMLFPLRKNHLTTSMGILTAIIMVLSGLWPLALLIGGFITTILDLIHQKSNNTGFWFTIPLSLLTLFYANIYMTPSLFEAIPMVTYIIIAVVFCLGILPIPALKHWSNLALMNEQDKNHYLASLAQLKALTKEAEIHAKNQQSLAVFARHIEILRLIELENEKLPDSMAIIVEEIGAQSIDILKIMKADPRDVIAGGQFLNRYLPLIHQSIVRYTTIKTLNNDDKISQDIDEKTLTSLKGMMQAFVQIKQQLASNDMDDLQVDLNVMDKLIRSQGFEIKD